MIDDYPRDGCVAFSLKISRLTIGFPGSDIEVLLNPVETMGKSKRYLAVHGCNEGDKWALASWDEESGSWCGSLPRLNIKGWALELPDL